MIKHPDANSPSGFRYELEASDMAAGKSVAFLTGPISGTMPLSDGSAYDVSEEIIAVAPEHRDELHRAIHRAHHAAGRFLDAPLPSE
jgi:hypothetical protein